MLATVLQSFGSLPALTVMFLIIMLWICFLCIGQNKSRWLKPFDTIHNTPFYIFLLTTFTLWCSADKLCPPANDLWCAADQLCPANDTWRAADYISCFLLLMTCDVLQITCFLLLMTCDVLQITCFLLLITYDWYAADNLFPPANGMWCSADNLLPPANDMMCCR